MGLVILLPLALVLDGPPAGAAEWRAVGFAMAGGLCEAAALACLLRGLVTGNLSIVTPLASLAGGFVAVIAIVGGESLSTPAMIGLPLAVAGGLLASVEKAPAEELSGLDEDAASDTPRDGSAVDAPAATEDARAAAAVVRAHGTSGAGWALLSSALFAVVILLLAEASALPPVAIAAYGRLGTMVVLVPVALLLAGLRLPRRLAGRCGVAGVFDAAGFILFAAAIGIGPLAVASVVIAQGGTMAVLLGYLVLHERLSWLQYVGVACTVRGLHAARDELDPPRGAARGVCRTASSAALAQVPLGDLPQPGPVERPSVPGIDDVHVQPAQHIHRRQVRLDVRLGQCVDQPAVVDRVAGDERAFLVIDQPDAARRVSRQVDHGEAPVAEVELVAAPHEVGRGGALRPEAVGSKPG